MENSYQTTPWWKIEAGTADEIWVSTSKHVKVSYNFWQIGSIRIPMQGTKSIQVQSFRMRPWKKILLEIHAKTWVLKSRLIQITKISGISGPSGFKVITGTIKDLWSKDSTKRRSFRNRHWKKKSSHWFSRNTSFKLEISWYLKICLHFWLSRFPSSFLIHNFSKSTNVLIDTSVKKIKSVVKDEDGIENRDLSILIAFFRCWTN